MRIRTVIILGALLALQGCETCPAMSRWSALSQIESGDNDAVTGRNGEVSRYQILPSLWSGGNPRDSHRALIVAQSIMARRTADFLKSHGRQPSDFEFYVLWNAPAQVNKPSQAVAERARRFANLVTKRSDKEGQYG